MFIPGRHYGLPCWMKFKTLQRVVHHVSRNANRAFPFFSPWFTESLIILIVWHISGFTNNLLRVPCIHFAVLWSNPFLSAERAQFSNFILMPLSTYKLKVSDKRVTQTANSLIFSACNQQNVALKKWRHFFLPLGKGFICPRYNI